MMDFVITLSKLVVDPLVTGGTNCKDTCSGRMAKFVRESEDIAGIGSLEKLFGKLQIISGFYGIYSEHVFNFVLISGDFSFCPRVVNCKINLTLQRRISAVSSWNKSPLSTEKSMTRDFNRSNL